MNSRQLTLILVVAIVLGAIGWVLFHRDAGAWHSQTTASRDKVIDFPLNDVAQITITDGTGELNLVNKPQGWVVGERSDYPANFEQVSRFLQKVWNLKPIETLQVGPSQFARFELTEPAKDTKGGTLLDLKNKDGKRITALLIGKQYFRKENENFGLAKIPAGRYVMPEDGSKHVFLIADPLQDLLIKPERWLNRDFVKIGKPKSIALEGTTPTEKWKIQRDAESADWKFADAMPNEVLDSARAAGLAASVVNMNFVDVLDPNAKPDITGLDHPSTVTIENFDGFTYTLHIGKLSDDKYPVTLSVAADLPAQRTAGPNEKAEDKKKLDDAFATREKGLQAKLTKEKAFEGRPFLINKLTITQLLKSRAALVKAEPSPSPSAPASAAAPKIPMKLSKPTPAKARVTPKPKS